MNSGQVPSNSQEIAARYGGEEFVIVLLGLGGQRALSVAQSIGKAIVNEAIPHNKGAAGAVTTFSAGVAFCYPTPDQYPEDLLKKADAALYQAMANGRNNRVLAV